MASLASHAPAVTRRAQRRLGIVLVIPVMIMMVIFFLLPLGNALYYSVVDFDGISPNPAFIGLANFKEMVIDPDVWHALGNNVIWIIIGTAVPMVIGLLIALLLWGVRRGSMLYRLASSCPSCCPAWRSASSGAGSTTRSRAAERGPGRDRSGEPAARLAG